MMSRVFSHHLADPLVRAARTAGAGANHLA